MKELNLKISDMVYNEIKNEIGVKKLSGSLYGSLDLFIVKVVRAIEKGDVQIKLAFKEGDPERCQH